MASRASEIICDLVESITGCHKVTDECISTEWFRKLKKLLRRRGDIMLRSMDDVSMFNKLRLPAVAVYVA